MKIIILAGGSGTRLWPMSRKHKPKQFYEIISDNSMIVDTYQRFLLDFKVEDIFISTNIDLLEQLKKLLPNIPVKNIIVDPIPKKDTGPSQGYVCAYLKQISPDEPIVFIPSDHYIANIKKFIECLKTGETLIKETNKMVDIGVQPNFPSTILGYTHIGELYKKYNDIEVYNFKGHTEKPEYKIAKEYTESGEYLWHANFYMWTPTLFLEAYKNNAPEIYEKLFLIENLLKENDTDKIKEIYNKLPKISIDYALTEKMDINDVLIIKGDFGWSDIGAWDVLYDKMKLSFDEDENLIHANSITIDTNKSLIYGNPDKLIATIGLNDMVIVDTKDALLICPKGRAQDVKKIVNLLIEKNKDQYV